MESKEILPESERVAIVGNNIILDDYLRNNWCEKLIKYQLALESFESENQKLREENERLKNEIGEEQEENEILQSKIKDLEDKVGEKEPDLYKIVFDILYKHWHVNKRLDIIQDWAREAVQDYLKNKKELIDSL